MNFIKTPRGFVILIAIPVAIFTAFELWNIKKELEKEIEKKMLTKFQKQSQITNSTLDNTISLH